MISLEGVVVALRPGPRPGAVDALRPAVLPKKTAGQLTLLEDAFRNYGLAGWEFARGGAGGVDVRIVFRNSTQAAVTLTPAADGSAPYSLAGCAVAAAPAGAGGQSEHVGAAGFLEGAMCLSSVSGEVHLHASLDPGSPRPARRVSTLAAGAATPAGRKPTQHVLAGRVHSVLAEYPNRLLLYSILDPLRPQLTHKGVFKEMEARIARVHALRWGCDGEKSMRVFGTAARGRGDGAQRAVVLSLVLETLAVDDGASSSYALPGDVAAAAGSGDGATWVTGCLNAAVHLYHVPTGKSAVRQEPAGRVAACVHVAPSYVVVGHSAPSLMLYDHALTPIHAFVPGVCEGVALDLRKMFGRDDACAAAVRSFASKDGGEDDVLGVVLRGGPVGVFNLRGALSTAQRLKHAASSPANAALLVHLSPSSRHRALLAQLVCKATAQRDAAAVDLVLQEFKARHARAPWFPPLFRRYFTELVHRGDVLNAYRVARDVDRPRWFDDVYASAVGTLDTAVLELCLSRASAELRDEVAALKACAKKAPKDEYSLQAMTDLLEQVDGGSAVETPTAVLLIKLVTFHRSFAEGQALLQRLVEKAERGVQDEVAAELKTHGADPVLLPMYAD